MLFVHVFLHEPSKEDVLSFREGDPIDHRAFVILRDRRALATYEAVVSLSRGESWQEVPGVQPPIRALTWIRTIEDDSVYARPVEGVVALVNMDTMEVVEVEDHGVTPLPARAGNYAAAALRDPANVPHVPAGPRTDLRPLEIAQAEGRSFELRGHEVRWQKWRFRIGFTPRGSDPAQEIPGNVSGPRPPIRIGSSIFGGAYRRSGRAHHATTFAEICSACSWRCTAYVRSQSSAV